MKFVAKTGSDSNLGTFESPYLTIGKAVTESLDVYVYPGVYNESVIARNNLSLRASGPGTVIDGSGFTAAVEIQGKHDVLVDGFEITNNGATVVGWSVPNGIAIRDLGNVPGVGRHSYNITIQNCTFRDILRKNDAVGNGAQPLLICSFSNERLGHTACYNVQILDCTFNAGKHDMVGSGLQIGQLCPTGNVRDFLIEGCTFYWDETLYNEVSTGIEFTANYEAFYSTYPDVPRRGVIRNNTFQLVGSLADPRYTIYVQGQDILVENNTFTRWGLGVGAVMEEGTNPDLWTTKNVWVRNNTFSEVTNYSVVVGAWENNYLTVENVFVTGNKIHKTTVAPGEFPPVSLISRNTLDSPSGYTNVSIVGNTVSAPDAVVLSEKDWAGVFRDNVFYTGSATPVKYPDYATDIALPWGDTVLPFRIPADPNTPTENWIPEWYTEGQFGEYSPAINPETVVPTGINLRHRKKRWYG